MKYPRSWNVSKGTYEVQFSPSWDTSGSSWWSSMHPLNVAMFSCYQQGTMILQHMWNSYRWWIRRIMFIRLENTVKFTSKAFDDYSMTMKIKVEHSVPHIHTQNGLEEASIKRIKWLEDVSIKRIKFITRLLLEGYNLPTIHVGVTRSCILPILSTFDHRPTLSTLLFNLRKGWHKKFPPL